MTTSATETVIRTGAGQNPLQALAGQLQAAGSRVGADTPLGNWLMSDAAAPMLLALVGALLMLLGWRLLRGRRVRVATPAQTPVAPTMTETAADEPGRNTHPEALAMLYDAPSRREPVVSVAAQEQSAAASPATATPVAAATIVTEPRRESVPSAAGDAAARDNPSLRLMVSAVDRLLQRVESQQAQIHALLDELKAQSSALLVQGERLLELEARVAGQTGVTPEIAVAGAVVATDQLPSLEQAIALAVQGADEHELVNRLGLSAAEARLINLVHGQAGATSSEVPA